jgi:hypothetical protein
MQRTVTIALYVIGVIACEQWLCSSVTADSVVQRSDMDTVV